MWEGKRLHSIARARKNWAPKSRPLDQNLAAKMAQFEKTGMASLALIAQTPLGDMGKPDDLADVAAFFASDDGRRVSGQVLQVSGGRV